MAELEKVIRGLECQYEPRMTCYGCDYFIARDKLCNKNKIFREAVDLLKAQEPRVMKMKELSALQIDTPVFIEENNDECGWNVFYGIDEENDVCFCGFKASADYYDLEEYGESWRCWTSQPTDEQRETTQWEN